MSCFLALWTSDLVCQVVFWKDSDFSHKTTPTNSNIDTKNDGLENPAKEVGEECFGDEPKIVRRWFGNCISFQTWLFGYLC